MGRLASAGADFSQASEMAFKRPYLRPQPLQAKRLHVQIRRRNRRLGIVANVGEGGINGHLGIVCQLRDIQQSSFQRSPTPSGFYGLCTAPMQARGEVSRQFAIL